MESHEKGLGSDQTDEIQLHEEMVVLTLWRRKRFLLKYDVSYTWFVSHVVRAKSRSPMTRTLLVEEVVPFSEIVSHEKRCVEYLRK